MKSHEINEYIYHYMTKDMTQSAIMLTGGWGTGKSYYIRNSLIPYMENKPVQESTQVINDRQSFQCIVISLYGISSISEISKSIYLEMRSQGIKKSKVYKQVALKIGKKIPQKFKKHGAEVVSVVKGYGVTILKGIAGNAGINIGMPDKKYEALYKSINMQGKLLIFEDVERSQVGILSLLGYINSLVEQDNIKVLLVANEDMFIKYEEMKDEKQEETGKRIEKDAVYTKETEEYLAIKEKTISDTIRLEPDLPDTIRSIIKSFNNADLLHFSEQSYVEDIIAIMHLYSRNLRSFIFACQKTVDICEHIQDKDNEDFLKCILYSIVAFSLRLKQGEKPKWNEQGKCSYELGIAKYPLFRFCYDYILFHVIDDKNINEAIDILKELRKYDSTKSQNDPDVQVIYNYYVEKEENVREAINQIEMKLQTDDIIAFSEYGRLAMCLIRISRILHLDIENIKELMIENLHGKGEKIRIENISSVIEEDEDKSVVVEFKELKNKMINSLRYKQDELFYGFNYTPDTVEEFYYNMTLHAYQVLHEGGLASRMDISKLVEMLKQCSAKQIYDLRGAYIAIYHKTDVPDDDIPNLKALHNELISLLDYEEYDAIQKLEIDYFAKNIAGYIRTSNVK